MNLLSPEWLVAAVVVLMCAAEFLHARRIRRLGRLSFGPEGKPRDWTRGVPVLRTAGAGALAWGLATLWSLGATFVKPREVPEGGWRHLVIALDVSPSMQLKDAGPDRTQTRSRRASDLVMSLLSRIALDQVRVSVVAFYSGAKPVVVDCMDVGVIRNILDDLPLELAFDGGKTSLVDGVREAGILGKPWHRDSATLLVVSDGDTTPDHGLPPLPPSFAHTLVVGVGDPASGRFIDGHQSRQDSAALRQLAGRLRGSYHDGNDRHLPSTELAVLSRVMPMRDASGPGRREMALAATAAGGGLLAFIPLALALAGSGWQTTPRSPNPIAKPFNELRPSAGTPAYRHPELTSTHLDSRT